MTSSFLVHWTKLEKVHTTHVPTAWKKTAMAVQMFFFFNGKPKPILMGGAKSPAQ
jgi:hypothetical protein